MKNLIVNYFMHKFKLITPTDNATLLEVVKIKYFTNSFLDSSCHFVSKQTFGQNFTQNDN